MLRVSLLGQVQFSLNQQELIGFVSSKAKALLCYLILNPQRSSRDALIALLWQDLPETDAKANLRVTLSNLRKILGDYLEITRQSVCFNQNLPYEIDTQTLERLLAQNHLREAAELYQGDFMHGFLLTDAALFEEWQVTERERLRRLALDIFQRLATKLSHEQDYAEAVKVSNKLLTLEPWRERSHRQLMLLYARTGEFSAALKQFDNCKQILWQELAVEPTLETHHLAERIRSARDLPRHNLAQDSTPFIGREKELSDLQECINNPDCRLITLVGTGGVGKTRLASQLARQTNKHFLEGAGFVALSFASSETDVLVAITDALRMPQEPNMLLKQQLIQYLETKEMLLIFDGAEHLLDTLSDFITDLLTKARALKVLVTSRECLHLQREWLYELKGLSYPETEDYNPGDHDATRLFVSIIKRLKTGIVLGIQELSSIAYVCRQMEGMPLGIELAAAWINTRALVEIATELGNGLELLSTSMKDVPARHRSIRVVFEQSWLQLEPTERKLLKNLSIFEDGFDLETARVLFKASSGLLTKLVNKSLLSFSEGRYRQHALLREFCTEKQKADIRQQRDLKTRHSHYFLNYVKEQVREMRGRNYLNENLANVRAAWQFALEEQDLTRIKETAMGLRTFYEMKGALNEGLHQFETARSVMEGTAAQTNMTRAYVQINLGALYHYASRYDEAIAQAQEGLSLMAGKTEDRIIFVAYSVLGAASTSRGNYQQAERFYEEGLARAKAAHDEHMIETLLGNLGSVKQHLGDYQQAEKLYQESLQRSRAGENTAQVITNLYNLSLIKLVQDQATEALAFLDEGLDLSRQGLLEHYIPYLLDNQGQAYFALGDYERAEKIYLQTLEEANEQDEPRQKSYVLPSLARALAAQGRTREAYARFSEALTVALHAGEHTQLLTIINCIAELMADEGETNKALELVRFVVVNELVDSGDKQRAEVLIEKLVNEPELRLNLEIKTTNEQIISLAKNLIPLLNERSAETQEDGYPH